MQYGVLCEKMNSKTNQHICTEFCIICEKTPKEMIALLKKDPRDEYLSNSSIKKLHKEFEGSRKSVHDAPRCGSPRTLVTEMKTNTMASFIEDDRKCVFTFFPLKIATRVDDLDFTQQAVSHMLFITESSFNALSTHFEPLYTHMYLVGPSNGTVLLYTPRLKIYWPTSVVLFSDFCGKFSEYFWTGTKKKQDFNFDFNLNFLTFPG